MRSWLRPLSRCLSLLLLVTVLAPGFGWQAAAGLAGETWAASQHAVLTADAHDATDLPMAAHAGEGDHAMHHMGHAGHDRAAEGVSQADASPEESNCSDGLHRCCPGVQLSHFQGGIADGLPPVPSLENGPFEPAAGARFSDFIPLAFERPPRHSAAA